MRPDLFEVIIERPRYGSGDRHPRDHRPIDPETAPKQAPMRPRPRTKCLSDNLAPLYRFLDAHVGKPWDKVYSELRAGLSTGSTVQLHILQHLHHHVELHVLMVNGVPCHNTGWGRGSPLVSRGRHGMLYVCPKTGLLRRAPVVPREKKG